MDFKTTFDGKALISDWTLDGGGLALDHGLATAIVISLFTDSMAHPDDVLPDGTTDRRGWWGDAFPPTAAPTDQPWRTGSRLWLLSREKQTSETARRAETYAREALAWMVAMGVAATVDVTGEWTGTGRLELVITVTRPTGYAEKYSHLWSPS